MVYYNQTAEGKEKKEKLKCSQRKKDFAYKRLMTEMMADFRNDGEQQKTIEHL